MFGVEVFKSHHNVEITLVTYRRVLIGWLDRAIDNQLLKNGLRTYRALCTARFCNNRALRLQYEN